MRRCLALAWLVAACSTASGGPDPDGGSVDLDGGCEGPELCDGLDNDCDGETDEDWADLGMPCTVGVGACEATGDLVCDAVGAGTECSAMPGTPAAMETCGNDLDDDCDGSADEGCECDPGASAACGTDVGECTAGTQTCNASGLWDPCAGGVLPTAEACDGLDQDCDGTSDNGANACGGACPLAGTPGDACDGGDADLCGEGAWSCAGLNDVTCSDATGDSTESCNGVDDDCDGATDDGNPGGGAACSTGLLGACGPGTTACSGGMVACQQTVWPTSEVCGDGADNDCDGAIDNGCGGCGPIGAPANGSVSAPSTGEGALATFSCNPGYRLARGQYSRCDDAIWRGAIPECRQVLSCGGCGGSYAAGDRVKAAVAGPSGASGVAAGTMGTVVASQAGGTSLELLIQWDGWSSGHTGNCSFATCGSCVESATANRWWTDCSQLQSARLTCACSGVYSEGDSVMAIADGPSGATGIWIGHLGTIVAGSTTAGAIEMLLQWSAWASGHTGNCSFAACGTCTESATANRWWTECTQFGRP